MRIADPQSVGGSARAVRARHRPRPRDARAVGAASAINRRVTRTIENMALSRVLLTLAAVIGVAALSTCRQRAQVESRPIAGGALRGSNVLLVTIDTLRADHVGAYGSPR